MLQTYYTQLSILEVLICITKDLESLRDEIIRKNQLMKKVTDDVVLLTFDALNRADLNDMINVRKKFFFKKLNID